MFSPFRLNEAEHAGIHDYAASKVINGVDVESTARKQFVRSSNHLAGSLYGCLFAHPTRFLLLFSPRAEHRVRRVLCLLLLVRVCATDNGSAFPSIAGDISNPRVSPVNGDRRAYRL